MTSTIITAKTELEEESNLNTKDFLQTIADSFEDVSILLFDSTQKPFSRSRKFRYKVYFSHKIKLNLNPLN